jgi:hypothetical protein
MFPDMILLETADQKVTANSSTTSLRIADQVCYSQLQSSSKAQEDGDNANGVILVPDTPDQILLDPWHQLSKTVAVAAAETTTATSIESWTELDTAGETAHLEAAAKDVLHKVLHNNNAEWTCEEQRKAVLEVLQLKHDVLILY